MGEFDDFPISVPCSIRLEVFFVLTHLSCSYDRILVMDAGNVAELDSPIALYDQGGIFRSMCDRSGIRREDFFNSEEANFTSESPVLEKTMSAADIGAR